MMKRIVVPLCIMAGLVGCFAFAKYSDGTSALLEKGVAFRARLADAPPEPLKPLKCEKREIAGLERGDICFLSKSDGPETLLVWGDSHGRIPFERLREELSGSYKLALAAKGGCALIGASPEKICEPMHQRIWSWLATQEKPVRVLFLFRWETSLASYVIGNDRQLADVKTLDNPEFRKRILGLPPHIETVFVEQVPRLASVNDPAYSEEALFNVSSQIAENPAISHYQVSSTDYARLSKSFIPVMKDLVAQRPGTSFVRVRKLFCDSVLKCVIYENGEMLYSDDNHINLAGAERLVAPILKALTN